MADTRSEAHEALLELIRDTAAEVNDKSVAPIGARAIVALRLAEAFAWVTNPNQSHGGTPAEK